jgi:hypothetical protein
MPPRCRHFADISTPLLIFAICRLIADRLPLRYCRAMPLPPPPAMLPPPLFAIAAAH